MEKKINLVEILRDCPNGMELDCTVFEGLEFDSIADNEYLPICCRIKNPDGGYNIYNFTKYGCWLDADFARCVIFPKGKTTWEGFVPPCIPNKFDINDLKPYDKVLVRDNDEQLWMADLFGSYHGKTNYPFRCVGHYTNQCVPYEGNELLLGTTDNCNEFYKTWEKQ